MLERFAVIGAGAWGTALAHHLASHQRDVSLWARRAELAAAPARTGQNPVLPRIELYGAVRVTSRLDSALSGAHAVVLAAPSHTVRELLARAKPDWPSGALLVSAAKGIETGTLLTLGEVAV